jgi:hypothetical protein
VLPGAQQCFLHDILSVHVIASQSQRIPPQRSGVLAVQLMHPVGIQMMFDTVI